MLLRYTSVLLQCGVTGPQPVCHMHYCDVQFSSECKRLSAFAVWRDMVAMQRRGTNVVIGGDRQKLGARELDLTSVVKRNKKQITAVLISLTAFAVLLSKLFKVSLLAMEHNVSVVFAFVSAWHMHGNSCPHPAPHPPPPSLFTILHSTPFWPPRCDRSTSQSAKAGMSSSVTTCLSQPRSHNQCSSSLPLPSQV